MDTEEASIYTAVLITSVVISVIIIYFAVSVIRQQRKKLELTRQNMLLEISTMERERSRVASDLHDDLGPVLSVVKFKIDNVKVPEEGDRLQLQDASIQVDGLIEKIREISINLMPSSLLRKGLFSSIEEFLRSIDNTGGAKINFNNNCNSNVADEVSIHIYRVIKRCYIMV
jgi:signal transduction histidine kinase